MQSEVSFPLVHSLQCAWSQALNQPQLLLLEESLQATSMFNMGHSCIIQIKEYVSHPGFTCSTEHRVIQKLARDLGTVLKYCLLKFVQSINQSINQSIDQSINQSINQPIINRSINQSIDRLINRSTNQSID